MRYGPEHKAQTRQKIVDAAAKVFRRCGFQGAGVDDVMSEAGLTAGGFYAHFPSKEALFFEAFFQVLNRATVLTGKADENLHGAEKVSAIAGRYLSAAHRVRIEDGCALPPLLADLARHNETVRIGFQRALEELLAGLSQNFPEAEAEQRWDHAVAVLAVLIGGMSLARAVADDACGERIMQACRNLIDQSLAVPNATSPSTAAPAKKKTVKKLRASDSPLPTKRKA